MSDKEEAAADDVSAEGSPDAEGAAEAGVKKTASRSKPRQLTAEEAIAIYRMRPQVCRGFES